MTDVLSATDLVKEYPVGQTSAPVLRGIDRSIQAGDYIAIMGPSGSGKTTLLNCLSSLDAPTSGRVVLDGQELTAVSESERAAIRLRRIGFVFQHPTFLANLNLLDNIVLPGYLAGHPRADVAKRALELVEAMGVADLCERTITQASGGQLQRVAICRALINAPDRRLRRRADRCAQPGHRARGAGHSRPDQQGRQHARVGHARSAGGRARDARAGHVRRAVHR